MIVTSFYIRKAIQETENARRAHTVGVVDGPGCLLPGRATLMRYFRSINVQRRLPVSGVQLPGPVTQPTREH